MAQSVFILGYSGTGKTYSLKGFDKDSVCYIGVQKCTLPFKGKFTEMHNTDDSREIKTIMGKTDKKIIVIDDGQYLMANEYMRRVNEDTWTVFKEIAEHTVSIIADKVKKLPDDVIVYFLWHMQSKDDGRESIKTLGRFVDEKYTPEGVTDIILKTSVTDGKYSFITQNSGRDTVKSPEGMFPSREIPNDLEYVDTCIREYYEIDGYKSAVTGNTDPGKGFEELKEENPVEAAMEKVEEIAEGREEVPFEEAMEAAGKEEPPKEEKPARRRRRRKAADELPFA